jgi:ABC-2 type transport system permease protein
MQSFRNIFWLGTKELRSFLHDWVLLILVIYSFSLAVLAQGQSSSQELHNASVGVVDEDNSVLSREIVQSFLPPYFKLPERVALREIDHLMNTGRYTFIIDIPPHFERDVVARRAPGIQVNVDATAMVQAGLGSSYAQQIINAKVTEFVARNSGSATPLITLAEHFSFNPNVITSWFTSVMGIINSVTMLAIIMAGAAVLREREHGTMDHLMVMPVSPFEIATAKVWANGLIITLAVGLSLTFVVRKILGIPIVGSIPLFLFGAALYLFFATAIGIFLGTVAKSMPQLGLIYMLIAMPMNILSGTSTPLESMPVWLSTIMQFVPSTHFVAFAQAILYRGAGLDVVWPAFLATAVIGALFFIAALLRFRSVSIATTS